MVIRRSTVVQIRSSANGQHDVFRDLHGRYSLGICGNHSNAGMARPLDIHRASGGHDIPDDVERRVRARQSILRND